MTPLLASLRRDGNRNGIVVKQPGKIFSSSAMIIENKDNSASRRVLSFPFCDHDQAETGLPPLQGTQPARSTAVWHAASRCQPQ